MSRCHRPKPSNKFIRDVPFDLPSRKAVPILFRTFTVPAAPRLIALATQDYQKSAARMS
jgi:hypothetical protein